MQDYAYTLDISTWTHYKAETIQHLEGPENAPNTHFVTQK